MKCCYCQWLWVPVPFGLDFGINWLWELEPLLVDCHWDSQSQKPQSWQWLERRSSYHARC